MAKRKSISEAMAQSDSIRMFENDLLERLSHVHPATVFVLYIPVIAVCLGLSFRDPALMPLLSVAYIAGGVVVWSLAEYLLHRFLFHIPRKGKLTKAIYFYTHGMHHDKPNDATRLVMPPGASIPLAVGFFFLFRWLLPSYYLPFFSGFLIGYVIYDFLHFAAHFFNFKNRYFKMIRRNHMIHHYRAPLKNFGFTSPVWDFVGGSYYKRQSVEDETLNDDSGLKPL